MTNKIILALEAEQMTKEIPTFAPGDTIVVQVKVKEGDRSRLQAFEGVVIAKRNRGVNSAFTVRKISNGVGVERTFRPTARKSTAWPSSVAVTYVKPSFTTSVTCLVKQLASRKNWFNPSLLAKKAALGLLFSCLRFTSGPAYIRTRFYQVVVP